MDRPEVSSYGAIDNVQALWPATLEAKRRLIDTSRPYEAEESTDQLGRRAAWQVAGTAALLMTAAVLIASYYSTTGGAAARPNAGGTSSVPEPLGGGGGSGGGGGGGIVGAVRKYQASMDIDDVGSTPYDLPTFNPTYSQAPSLVPRPTWVPTVSRTPTPRPSFAPSGTPSPRPTTAAPSVTPIPTVTPFPSISWMPTVSPTMPPSETSCPAGLFEQSLPSQNKVLGLLWCLVELYVAVPIALAGVRVGAFLLCFNAFVIVAGPLLAVPAQQLWDAFAGRSNFSAGALITLWCALQAGFLAAYQAHKASPGAQLLGHLATLGALIAVFIQAFFTHELVSSGDMSQSTADWVLFGGCSLGALLFVVAACVGTVSHAVVMMLLAAVLGSFLVTSAVSELVGGGAISLAGLMTGDVGACNIVGYTILFLWAGIAILSAAAQVHGYVTPRGSFADRCIRRVFFVVFNLDYLLGGEDAYDLPSAEGIGSKASATASHDL